MKKIIILLTVLAIAATSLVAIPKKPLFEVFTSSTCPPCANANQILDEVLFDNPGQYSLIKYQVNWPAAGDPYYIPETWTRVIYYDVTGVPRLISNGGEDEIWDFTQEYFETFLQEDTGLAISAVASIDDNDLVTVETTITAEEAYAAGLKFFVAIVEKTTVGNVGTNGETDFHNVIMALLPDGNGMSLDAFTVGSQLDLVDTFDMSSTFMEQPNDLSVIVLIQDDTDQQLIQSEMVDVTGTFDDYVLTFNITDSDGNLVDDAEIYLEEYGTKYSDENGQVVYDGMYPGIYDYDVFKTGLFPTSGTVEIIDQDVTVDIVLEVPQDYFYEDFGTEIPADWTVHTTSPDFLYWYDGRVILFRQNSTYNPIILVSPEIDFGPVDSLYFDAGESQLNPHGSFGIITDPTDPTTFVLIEDFYPGVEWEEYAYDISDLSGSGYLAWVLQDTGTMRYFSFDNVRLTVPAVQPLEPPTNLVVDTMTGHFTWEAPVMDDLIGYDVYLNDELQGNTTDLQWQFTELVNGTVYEAGVVAVYDEGFSDMATLGFTYEGTEVENNLVAVTELESNYPNPFNPTTNITYSIKDAGNVTLGIYNLKGQLVKTLVNEVIETGKHTATWNGTDNTNKPVSSGVYFYKLKSGSYTSTRKMILLK